MSKTETKVKERPILFSASMVRAILEGRKTQTRRIIRGLPDGQGVCACGYSGGWARELPDGSCSCKPVTCPYGKPGDRLWVRETFRYVDFEHVDGTWSAAVQYEADSARGPRTNEVNEDTRLGPRPSIYMPRWASRILLDVTAVRVERLQDISEEDAIAEGLAHVGYSKMLGFRLYSLDPKADPEKHYTEESTTYDDPRSLYSDLWGHINGPGSWDANPWVWVVEFKRVSVG